MLSADDIKNLIDRFNNLKNYEAAEMLIVQALKANPDDHSLYARMADLCLVKSRVDLAVQNLEAAYRLAPNNPDYKFKILELTAIQAAHDQPAASVKEDREPSKPVSTDQVNPERDWDEYLNANYAFHPYLGFMFKSKERVNNHGFMFPDQRIDYPYNGKTKTPYIVGIYGGSVAGSLCYDGHGIIAERLSRIPALAGREILVLPFAQGSYCQPQQLIGLIYFHLIGQRFDLVINVDGFNESNSGRTNQINGVHPALPAYNMISALRLSKADGDLSSESLSYLLELSKLKDGIRDWEARKSAFPFNLLAGPILHNKKQAYDDLSRRPPKQNAKEDGSLLMLLSQEPFNLYDRQRTAEAVAFGTNQVARIWSQSSALMAQICTSIGAHYIHALQPNQYFCDKPFSKEEREKYYLPESDTALVVKDMYPLYQNEGQTLSDQGVDFLDMTKIYDDVEETIYRDAGCHVNRLGNSIMANAVMDFTIGRIAP